MDSATSHRLLRRVIAIVALAVWAAPGAGAAAVVLHLALGHHHDDHHHAEDHQAAALELALATVHGHHHEDLEAMPDHEHPAPSGGGPSVAVNTLAAADPPPAGLASCVTGPSNEEPSPARRAPPSPLYHTHCSLLL